MIVGWIDQYDNIICEYCANPEDMDRPINDYDEWDMYIYCCECKEKLEVNYIYYPTFTWNGLLDEWDLNHDIWEFLSFFFYYLKFGEENA